MSIERWAVGEALQELKDAEQLVTQAKEKLVTAFKRLDWEHHHLINVTGQLQLKLYYEVERVRQQLGETS